MAHYDLYRDRLATTHPAFGYALWEPSPEANYGPVRIGDVGFVREGKFCRLFNALLPADDASHEGIPLPDNHEPLVLDVPDHISTGALRPNQYCSAGVSVLPPEPEYLASPFQDYPQVSFSCTRRRGGALLSLPVDAQRQDTRARGAFGRWMLQRIGSWLAFTQKHGLGIEMEEIVLVTGCHLTRSWANVTFLEGQAHAQASFGINVTQGHDVCINWHFGTAQGVLCNWGPEGPNLPEDQCVFIRGFRVVRVFGIFPRHLKGAAGPNPSLDGDQDDDEPDKELISISASMKVRDSLLVLLDYIIERSPDCDMVLVHDDDLARVARSRESEETFQSETLMTCLQKTQPEIQQIKINRCEDCLSNNEDITGTINVAMFLEEFNEWSLAPPRPSTASQDSRSFCPSGSSVTAPTTHNDPHHNSLISTMDISFGDHIQSTYHGRIRPSSSDEGAESGIQRHCQRPTSSPSPSLGPSVSPRIDTPLSTLACSACGKTFNRYQDTERHIQSFHLPCWIFCPYLGCRWRGHRMEDFDRHMDTQNCGSKPKGFQYQIYDVKMVLSWIKGSTSAHDISMGQSVALELVKEKAVELGRHEWLDDPWGFSPSSRARRVCDSRIVYEPPIEQRSSA